MKYRMHFREKYGKCLVTFRFGKSPASNFAHFVSHILNLSVNRYAEGLHQESALCNCWDCILFIFIMIINLNLCRWKRKNVNDGSNEVNGTKIRHQTVLYLCTYHIVVQILTVYAHFSDRLKYVCQGYPGRINWGDPYSIIWY